MNRALAYGAVLALAGCAATAAAPVAPLPEPQPLPPLPSSAGSTQSALAPSLPVAPTSSTASPASPASPPAVSQGDIGGDGPAEVLAASVSAAWVALCQGEPPSLSLVLGSGVGEPIGDVHAQDPSGRYVVVRSSSGAALLIDSVSGARVDLTALGADVRRTRSDYASHRSLSFSSDGKQLAYLRKQGQGSVLVVRQLAEGTERSFLTGAGEVFSLRLSADARYVSLEVLREDTSKNGKLDWPTPEETAPRAACGRAALPKFRSFAYQGRGDAVTRAVVSLQDGALRDVPGLITPLGAALLVREEDGSLRLDLGAKRSALAPASCAGRVLFADADRGLSLVACATSKKTSKRDVWLLGANYAKDLKSQLYETGTDREAVSGARLVPLYAGSEAGLVDLEHRELLPLPATSRVVSVVGETALLWRGSELYRYDARSRSESRLARGVLRNPDLLRSGMAVLLSPFVVVGDGPALRSPTERPLALSLTGHLLVGREAPAAGASATGEPVYGPLHWLDARLAGPDGSPR